MSCVKLSKRCQIVKSQKVKHVDYGKGSQKINIMRFTHIDVNLLAKIHVVVHGPCMYPCTPSRPVSVQKVPTLAYFATFWVPYKPPGGKITSDSSRGGHKLQNKYSNIKISKEIASGMTKQ